MNDLQKEVVEIIERELTFGFMEEDELLEEMLETFADDDVDPQWVGKEVHRRYADRQAEIAEWDPDEANDFDRLANAFDELCEHRIIALHRAGYSTEDGIEEVTEAFKALAERGINPKGYVFYHTGHLERAIDEKRRRLDLVFGAAGRAESQLREVGNLITLTLQRYDLDARWTGSAGDNVEIHHIDWEKEPDDEDWGVERAVSIISGEDEAVEAYEEEE